MLQALYKPLTHGPLGNTLDPDNSMLFESGCRDHTAWSSLSRISAGLLSNTQSRMVCARCYRALRGHSEATPGSAASTVSTDLMHSTDCVALGCSLLVGKDLARMDLPKGWRHLLPAPYNQTLVLGEPCLRRKDSGLPVQHVKMMDRSEEEQVTLLWQAGFPMPAQSYRG